MADSVPSLTSTAANTPSSTTTSCTANALFTGSAATSPTSPASTSSPPPHQSAVANGPASVAPSTSALAPPTSVPKTASPPAVATAVKRACDACHRRKVRCIGDGSRSCRNCTSASLTCTYNAIPQKKGPKGSRAKVISELRETQRLQLAAKRASSFYNDADSPPHSPAYLQKAGLLSRPMIRACLDYFFHHLWPTQPVLHCNRIDKMIAGMDHSPEAYVLVVALCAYMMIQPNVEMPPDAFDGLDTAPQSSMQLGHRLLQEAMSARRDINYIENPSVWSVLTSFFFFGSYFCLDRHNTAWFHLREATTLAQILGMHEESSYCSPDDVENSRRRRLYWLLFVTERAYALQQHRPLTLHATIGLPTIDKETTETFTLNGFLHLVNLFRPFDDTFVGLWNKSRTDCSAEWLGDLQAKLSDALPEYLHCTESQAVDLRCSQHWLRTMVWQLSISHGLLSSAASDNALSFRFPIEVSRDLVQATSMFTKEAMEVHGIGLIEKIFDIACTLTDVISVLPNEQYTFELGPRHYLNQLMTIISSLRGGHQRYYPLLMQKIQDTVPNNPGYPINFTPEMMGSTKKYLIENGETYDAQPVTLLSGVAGSSMHTGPYSTQLISADATPFPYGDMVGASALQDPAAAVPNAATVAFLRTTRAMLADGANYETTV